MEHRIDHVPDHDSYLDAPYQRQFDGEDGCEDDDSRADDPGLAEEWEDDDDD